MSLPFKLVVLLSAVFWATTSVADGDVARGERLAATCMGCHAVSGYFNVYPTYRVPKLGGQGEKYIASALMAYKDGSRAHDTMHANAANLSDQDMADIGAFVAQHGK